MSSENQQLEAGLAALEAQRSVPGDAVIDAAVTGVRAEPAELTASALPPRERAQTLKQVSIQFLDVVGFAIPGTESLRRAATQAKPKVLESIAAGRTQMGQLRTGLTL